MDDPVRNELREYAWKYFSLHADQRLKTFNFYLTLYAFAFGGLVVFIKDAKSAALGVFAGVVLALLSFVFWRFDGRNKELVEVSHAALRQLEADDERVSGATDAPHPTTLFSSEKLFTDKQKKDKPLTWNPLTWWTAHYTYSRCFNVLFLVFGIAGILLALYYICSMFFTIPLMPYGAN